MHLLLDKFRNILAYVSVDSIYVMCRGSDGTDAKLGNKCNNELAVSRHLVTGDAYSTLYYS
jgi:hypothetical protein